MTRSVFRSLTQRRKAPSLKRRYAHPPAFRPGVETLEGRVVPSTVRWINPAGGDWSVAVNWDAGQVPGPSDDAVIDLPGSYQVTHTAGADAVHSLTSQQPLILSGGSLAVADVSVLGDFDLAGGTFAGSGNMTVNGRLRWTAGTLTGTDGTVRAVALGGLEISGTAEKILDHRVLENDADGSLSGSPVTLRLGTFTNAADGFLVVTHGDLIAEAPFDLNAFVNDGQVRVFESFGITAGDFVNNGSIEVYTGGLGYGATRGHFENSGSIKLWDDHGTLFSHGDRFESTGSIIGSGGVSVTSVDYTSIRGEFHVEGDASFNLGGFGSDVPDFYVGGTLSFDTAGFGFSDSDIHVRNLSAHDSIHSGGIFRQSSLSVSLSFDMGGQPMSGNDLTFISSTVSVNTFTVAGTYVTLQDSAIAARAFVNGGHLDMDSSSVISTLEGFTNRGLLNGAGVIDGDLINENQVNVGTIVGAGTAQLIITGSFTQTAAGYLYVSLGDPSNGGTGSPLQILGAARLDGTFAAAVPVGYVPQEGDTYQPIAVGGAVYGAFTEQDLPGLADGLFWDAVFQDGVYTLMVHRQG